MKKKLDHWLQSFVFYSTNSKLLLNNCTKKEGKKSIQLFRLFLKKIT